MSGTDQGADEFAEFEKAGEVEVGTDAIESNEADDAEKPAKPAKPKDAKKPKEPAEPASDDDEEDAEADDADDGEEDEEEEKPKGKTKQKPSERIRELSARLRAEERLRRAADERLTNLEKNLLPANRTDANSSGDRGNTPAPDPSDEDKYPLGHLDDRYIEDKLDWLATQKAAERADAVLQRQQESEQLAQAEKAHAELLEKVDDLSTRGSEQYDDFQEAVVEAGMRGDWRLDQPTFEAAHEAENGSQILYELSQDKKEAARVAGLSPYNQLKFVMERDAEISAKGKARKIPGAGAPPATQTRGANSRTRISPTTDNLDDFEKAWEADAKGKR